jgi:phosphoribosylamine--glycine ligase
MVTNPMSLYKKSIKKILVVGSWAKEQITIENIKHNSAYKVYVYMDTKNPGIISIADGYKIGNLNNLEDIVTYAKNQKIDLVLITTAAPLSLGLVDKLEKENIFAFGPKKNAARLESDKAFSRALMKAHGINAIPRFGVFDNRDEAYAFAEELEWRVAVKPIGLTEGLGVQVFGDQLKNKEEVISYIDKILNKKIGKNSKVLIEEKIVGEEFTIQCFIHDNQIIPTPAVQDFKKLLPGDEGPNTASMGSYADSNYLLPFMTQEDYVNGLDIIMKTLTALYAETGEMCCGFLYGQFMLTEKGIRLIEYNFRPGDPEWMNTLSVLKENIIDIITQLIQGKQLMIHFEEQATVCKYIVPEGYPKKLNQVLKISFKKDDIKDMGVDTFYSAGFDYQGRLRNGSERGIALVAKADTIFEANEMIEHAITLIDGEFHYRYDIGSLESMDIKLLNKQRAGS